MEQKENNNSIIEYINNNDEIKSLIYTIRGKQVMLDSDVARLYHYATKRINEAVNRNKSRFPEEFCFQLTKYEIETLRLQFTNTYEQENKLLAIERVPEDKTMRSQFATASKRQ